MKIHEVVPLSKELKSRVLQYCRENKISGDLIYLGKGEDTWLSNKYNEGDTFAGLQYMLNDSLMWDDSWRGRNSDGHYFATYKCFKNKSLVQKPKKKNKPNTQLSLEQRVAQLEAKLSSLINALQSVSTSNNP